MTYIEFRATLAGLGLKQIDLARLLAHFDPSWNFDPVTVNRWALPPPRGVRVPAPMNLALHLWSELPNRKRQAILDAARAAHKRR
jgi:hypothetical protein